MTSRLNSLQQVGRPVARAQNSSQAQFRVTSDPKNSVLSTAVRDQPDQGRMVDLLCSHERVQLEVVKLLGPVLFRSVQNPS
ncbi:hypothetical protein [Kocuria nitroreducens]|uniref:hypothetical protein n=1 Tax=Kocuria nitroreducens TaxID=3058914 RepID=UPI0036D91983